MKIGDALELHEIIIDALIASIARSHAALAENSEASGFSPRQYVKPLVGIINDQEAAKAALKELGNVDLGYIDLEAMADARATLLCKSRPALDHHVLSDAILTGLDRALSYSEMIALFVGDIKRQAEQGATHGG